MGGSSSRLASLFFITVLLALPGCGGEKTPTAGDDFKKNQAPTMMTGGGIKIETVREIDEKIQYQTTDGKTWRVGYSKRNDGTYRYGTPEGVE